MSKRRSSPTRTRTEAPVSTGSAASYSKKVKHEAIGDKGGIAPSVSLSQHSHIAPNLTPLLAPLSRTTNQQLQHALADNNEASAEELRSLIERDIESIHAAYEVYQTSYLRSYVQANRNKAASYLQLRLHNVKPYVAIPCTLQSDIGAVTDTSYTAFQSHSDHALYPTPPTLTLAPNPSIPPLSSYVPTKRNIAAEDDKLLRFLPYFGDHDPSSVDISLYAAEQADSSLQEQGDEEVLYQILTKYGTHQRIYSVLSELLQCSIEGLKNRYAEMLCIATQRTEQQQCMLTVQGVDTEPVTSISNSYEKFFCRRCYVYDCQQHGTAQPRAQGSEANGWTYQRTVPNNEQLVTAQQQQQQQQSSSSCTLAQPTARVPHKMERVTDDAADANSQLSSQHLPPPSPSPPASSPSPATPHSQAHTSHAASPAATPTPTVPCTRSCYLTSTLQRTGAKKNASSLSSASSSDWSELEKVLLRKLYYMNGPNCCMLSSLMASKTCSQIYQYIQQHEPNMTKHRKSP